MINSTEISEADLLLHDADFPDNYVHMQHPEDYIAVPEPFVDYIPHFSGRHNRLIARVCWIKSCTEYVPMSFVCDTGAPMGLYLSDNALQVLKACHRIIEDEAGTEHVYIKGVGKVAVDSTPSGHKPANIMGLRLLTKLELKLNGDSTFIFGNMPVAL